MRQETALFIASQLREDRNPLDLWTANHTFLNERLARHYGVPGTFVSRIDADSAVALRHLPLFVIRR